MRSTNLRRPTLCSIGIIAIVAALALALATTAEATATKSKAINASLVGTGCGVTGLECGSGGGGSCLCFFAFWNFAGQSNSSPPVGALRFSGYYSDGSFCSTSGPDLTCLGPITYVHTLTLTLTAANGDKLVLVEDVSSTEPLPLLSRGANPVNGTWSVDRAQSTGRFSRYSGSGTYTLTYEGHDTYATFLIDLTGNLTFTS